MTKTKYQESVMDFAKDYLDMLLDVESYVGRRLDQHITKMVEQKFHEYLKKENDKKNH